MSRFDSGSSGARPVNGISRCERLSGRHVRIRRGLNAGRCFGKGGLRGMVLEFVAVQVGFELDSIRIRPYLWEGRKANVREQSF